jgi:hypothetical protein
MLSTTNSIGTRDVTRSVDNSVPSKAQYSFDLDFRKSRTLTYDQQRSGFSEGIHALQKRLSDSHDAMVSHELSGNILLLFVEITDPSVLDSENRRSVIRTEISIEVRRIGQAHLIVVNDRSDRDSSADDVAENDTLTDYETLEG